MEDFEKVEKAKLREQREKRRATEGNVSFTGSSVGHGNLTANGTAGSNVSSTSFPGSAGLGQAGAGNGFRSQLQQRRGQEERIKEDKRMLISGFRQVRSAE